eukprot:s219_g7.t1
MLRLSSSQGMRTGPCDSFQGLLHTTELMDKMFDNWESAAWVTWDKQCTISLNSMGLPFARWLQEKKANHQCSQNCYAGLPGLKGAMAGLKLSSRLTGGINTSPSHRTESSSCRSEKTVKTDKTWIVQHIAPLREQRADGVLELRPETAETAGRSKSSWDPPNLAAYLQHRPEVKEENYLRERTMQRGPAPPLGHSVQHVIDTVRATRARREAVAVSADAKDQTKDREAGSPRGSPRSPRSPYGPRSPRRSTLLDQLLQQQVLGKSSRSPSAGCNGHGYPIPDAVGTSLEAPLPTSSRLSIPVLHRSGRGMAHLLGRPLEVVQEEFEAFSESVGSRSRPTAHSTPRVADLPAKVKWETLLASREASRQAAGCSTGCPTGCPTTYLLKDRFKTCKISRSIMASRFSEPSDPGLSDLMLQECTWCRAALPATAARSEGLIQCPSCHRSFDGRKAKMSMFGGEGLL